MPNTTFSQNVGLIAMTGMMSRHVVTLGAALLVVSGLLPKVGAVITTIPIEVLGGGVIVMFGMVASSALSMLSRVEWSQRNMLIFGTALSLSLGLQLEPGALAYMAETPRILLSSGVLPGALIALLLNLVLPQEIGGEMALSVK
jgi:NCS2 family nucleobase:cation symporter-2